MHHRVAVGQWKNPFCPQPTHRPQGSRASASGRVRSCLPLVRPWEPRRIIPDRRVEFLHRPFLRLPKSKRLQQHEVGPASRAGLGTFRRAEPDWEPSSAARLAAPTCSVRASKVKRLKASFRAPCRTAWATYWRRSLPFYPESRVENGERMSPGVRGLDARQGISTLTGRFARPDHSL